MKVVTPAQMREIDSRTINRIGIPGAVLMENAALAVVEEITRSLGCVAGKNIVILAGKGNNGGDAFAAARHLYNKGAVLNVYILADRNSISGDARINLDILEHMDIYPIELTHDSQFDSLINNLRAADLVVDGIFGTGLKGEITGLAEKVIRSVNDEARQVISIDIPSGVDGETGKIPGICVKAHKTVTFGLPKTGLIIHPGCEYTGELTVADISIPAKVINGLDIRLNLIEQKHVSKLIPKRFDNSNKGDYGKILIVSGSTGMTGAGCLAAGAAFRTGAGLVYLGVPASLVSIYDSLLAESVTIPLEDNGNGYLTENCANQVLDRMKHISAAAVGPGMSLNADTCEVVYKIIESSDIPLVLDADALNAVSKDTSILKKLKTEAVITPHPGEMSRLAGITIEDVQNNRIETAREFAARWKMVTVLKGSRTVVAVPDGTVYVNVTGNPGMATAGAGDVLTGVITGLIGQGVKPADAAVAGVYLHGLAGDIVAKMKGVHGLIAGDLVGSLPYAVRQVLNEK